MDVWEIDDNSDQFLIRPLTATEQKQNLFGS